MIVKIPIHLGSNNNVDDIGLGPLGAELRDAIVDELNNVRKRPGIDDFADTGTAAKVDGLYWWKEQNKVIAVSNGSTFSLDSAGNVTNITGATFEVGKRVYFANFRTALYAANGGQIVKIPASGTTSYLTDPDAPTAVSHLAYLDQYLIAKTTDQEFKWAEVTTPEDWQGQFANAERHPDDLKALAVANAVIHLWGGQTLEIWRNTGDANDPFVSEYQGYVNVGISAPDSIAFCADQWYWLDNNRNLVRLAGRSYEYLPAQNHQSLSQYIQGFATVSDAVGDYVVISGRHFYVLSFPTENKTIVYDIGKNLWKEWSYWRSDLESYERYRGQCYVYADGWNKRLIGDKENGNVYELATTNLADGQISALLDENGDPLLTEDGELILSAQNSIAEIIRTSVRTGTFDHGTPSKRKFSKQYTAVVKRNTTSENTPFGNIILRYRDNGKSSGGPNNDGFKEERIAAINNIDETTYVLKWRRNGSYYTRQIELVNADPAPLLLVSFEEDVEFEQ